MELRKLSLENNESIQIRIGLETAVSITAKDGALEDVIEGGEVIMLLRLNFLGAQKRKRFWDFAPLKHIYVLSKRPHFTLGQGDSCEYAWFVFQDGYEGQTTIEVI